MRALTERLRDGQWRGRRAFVVGSGPSLKGFDFSLLDNDLTIGCNEEYRWGPTIAICQDLRFFSQEIPGRIPAKDNPHWTSNGSVPVYFKGHADRQDVEAPDSVYQIGSADGKEAFAWGKSLREGLYYGANVGMSALNLAEILGANPIYLLGFDANPADQATHHHDHYPPEWKLDQADDRRIVYQKWRAEFRALTRHIKARVVNLNPDSGIDAFPKEQINVLETAALRRVVVTSL